LKLLRVKMGRGWSLREAHQSPKIQKGLDVETNDQYSELKRLYRRVTNALLNVFMERG
jgi:outer membrane lipopolysaccharide assembly protein LptE/RlpB